MLSGAEKLLDQWAHGELDDDGLIGKYGDRAGAVFVGRHAARDDGNLAWCLAETHGVCRSGVESGDDERALSQCQRDLMRAGLTGGLSTVCGSPAPLRPAARGEACRLLRGPLGRYLRR